MNRNEFLWTLNLFAWWLNLSMLIPMTPDQIHVLFIMSLIALYEWTCSILWRSELDQTTKDMYNIKA